MRGSVGSVAILLRVLRGRIFFDVLDTTYLTPVWDPEAPDTLLPVTEKYKVPGALLAARATNPDPQSTTGSCAAGTRRRDLVRAAAGGSLEPDIDDARSVQHGLGFVPMVWVRNLPGHRHRERRRRLHIPAAIETQIEIDYQLSQAGRGLKYSSDPTLLIKEPATATARSSRAPATRWWSAKKATPSCWKSAARRRPR